MFINRQLLSFIKGNSGKVVISCLMQLLITFLSTLIALGSALCVRFIQGEESILFFSSLWQVLLAIATFLIMRHVLLHKKAVLAEKSGIAIKANLREQLLDKLFRLGPAYTMAQRTGNTTSMLYSRVEFLTAYYTTYLPSAMSAICNAVAILIIIGAFNTLTAALCTLACVGILGCPMLFYPIMRKRGEKEMALHGKYYSDCLDSLQGMTTLKAFNADGRQRQVIAQSGEVAKAHGAATHHQVGKCGVALLSPWARRSQLSLRRSRHMLATCFRGSLPMPVYDMPVFAHDYLAERMASGYQGITAQPASSR